MKKLILSALLALSVVTVFPTTGCKIAPTAPRAKTFLLLKDTGIAVDRAMQVYGEMCAKGKVSADNQVKVDNAYNAFVPVWRNAIKMTGSENGVTPDNVSRLAQDLLLIISKL